MITQIVTKINQLIAEKMEKHPCLSGFCTFGLSETITRRYSEDEIFPAVVNTDGESMDVFADDDFPLGIYHRLLSKQYAQTNKKERFGDDYVQLIIADLILVCWAFREKTGATADELETLIYSSMPEHVSMTSSNFDRRSVFSGEFSGIPFNVPEDVMLFSMKYKYVYPVSSRDCTEIHNLCNKI